MRIALFTENYCRGGLDTFIATLINHWPDRTDDFVLICNADYPGIEVIRARLTRPCSFVTYDFGTYAGLAQRTAGRKLADRVRVASSPLLRYLYLGREVKALKSVLADSGAERLMVVNGGYPGGDACRAAGIAWGLCSGRAASIHNFHNLATAPGKAALFQENAVDAMLAKHTKAFITVSHAAAESMELRPAIPAEKVSYIYNGLEAACDAGTGSAGACPPPSDPRSELGLPEHALLCLMLGTYEPRKGHHFLLRAFSKVADAVPQAHFLIGGHGSPEETASVRKMIEDLGLGGRVHLLGFRSDAMSLLQLTDLLLVGSQEFESFGLTCVEAMARRVPVVSTNVGGLPEVVVDGDGGFCTGRDDVDSFAAHVIDLLSDVNLRKEQGEKGYQRYLRLFTADRMAREYAALIKGND